jgi:Big-like domain-containing protein
MTHVPTPVTAARKAGIARRLVGFGAAGFAAALVAAPMAHAAPAAADAGSDSSTPPEGATPPDTATPTDTGPSPSNPAPSGSTPVSSPASSAPTSSAPTSSAPTSPAPSSAASTPAPSAAPQPRAKKVQVAPQADPGPIYGAQKVFVGIQTQTGDYYQPNADLLAGATLNYIETDIDGNAVLGGTGTCTTVAGGSCTLLILAPGDSLLVAQTSAPNGPYVLLNPQPVLVGPCTEPAAPIAPGAVTADAVAAPCSASNLAFAIITDQAAPPVAQDKSATIRSGDSVYVHPLANDSARGAPATLSVTRPAHGSAVVLGSRIKYTPAPGFGGVDTFSYTIRTDNGPSTATATITVKAPPIAKNNAATTVGGSGAAGQPVTIPVLTNDSANGGGPVTLAAVANPPHGTAAIRGGNVIYTPDAGFVGTDAFSYTIRTANGTATATIRVTVTAPVIVASANDQLASTGAPSEQLLGVGSLLLLVGGGATVAGRRRRVQA